MKKLVLVSVLALALLLGAASFATADSSGPILGTGSPRTASGTVNVSAAVNPKLTLTIVTPDVGQLVDFGAVDPGTNYGPLPVGVTVSSNKIFSLSKTITGAAPIGLTTTLADSTGNVRTASQAFPDTYSINVPWTTDAGTYTATVQYTVTQ